MNRNIWKQAAAAAAISAATGLAFAQATHPSAGSHTSKTDDSAKSEGKIISDETQAPEKATSTTTRSEARSGEGAGASSETSGEIISDQTQSAGKATAGKSQANRATTGDPSTKTSSDIINNDTE